MNIFIKSTPSPSFSAASLSGNMPFTYATIQQGSGKNRGDYTADYRVPGNDGNIRNLLCLRDAPTPR